MKKEGGGGQWVGRRNHPIKKQTRRLSAVSSWFYTLTVC